MRSAFTSLLLTATLGLLAGPGSAVAAVTTTGSLATARTQAAGVSLGGSSTTSVLVTGGFDAATPAVELASTERYDVATGTWSPGAPLNTGRARHHAFYVPSLTRLRNGPGIVVVGGVQVIRGSISAVGQPELYDIGAGTWTAGVAATPPRQFDAAALTTNAAGDPIVVVTGGLVAGAAPTTTNTVDRYDIENNTWAAAAPMATARREHAAVPLPDGRILVAGGLSAANVPLATTEIYDPAANAWKAGPPLITARTNFTLSLVDARHVVATGGVSGTTALATSEAIDPTFLSSYPTTPNAWAGVGAMAVPRADQAATVVRNGWLAVTGGRTNAAAFGLDSAESWTPANAWGGLYATPGSSAIGGARIDHVAAAIPQTDQVLLAGGGVVAGNAASTVTASAVLWKPDAPVVAPPTTPPTTPPATTPDPTPAAPTPVQGRIFVAGRASGNVFVRIGTTDEYRELTADEALPIGIVIDATDGHVRVRAVVGGVPTTAEFWGGTFIVTQPKSGGWLEVRPFGTLKCKNGKPIKSSKRAERLIKRKSKPRVWGDGKGKIRTRGKHSTASVRGTRWLVEERCTGTFTKVSRGKVDVRDFAKHKTVRVKAGKNYIARPGRK